MRLVTTFIAIVTLVLITGRASAAELVTNGGFESSSLAPFTYSGDYADVLTDTPHNGTYHAQAFNNTGDGYIRQVLSTTPGASYTVSAYVQNNGDPVNEARIGLGSNTPYTCAPLTDSYALCSASFVAQTSSDAVYVFFRL